MHTEVIIIIKCREAVAYFHCDKDAKTPRAETVGDSKSFLHYVRNTTVQTVHVYYSWSKHV